MLERLHTAPDNVLVFKASGRITDEDYKTVLIPAIEDRIKTDGKIRFVYVIGPECGGVDAGAVLDDALFGLHHWRDFERIGIVTDHDWIARAMRMFMPLMPARTRLFGIDQMQAALSWAAT
ncbi:MAG: STAS/SEC14 domain-containing protein [Paracoccaceae bacterium]